MTYEYENVRDFMLSFGQQFPDEVKMVDYKTQVFRYSLIEEESLELYKACNIVEYTDAIVDLLYVTLGAAVAAGIGPAKLQRAWDEVHSSNMTKFWTDDEVKNALKTYTVTKVSDNRHIVRDAKGKVIKSPSYRKANLEFLRKEQP